MSRLSLTLLCWLLLSLPAQAAGDLLVQPVASRIDNTRFDAVVGRLESASRVRSEFLQTKTMKLLRRPLVSEGRMIFDRDYGLYWQIDTPFPSTLVVTGEAIRQRSGDQQSTVTVQQNPVAVGFAQIFFQVLSGDIEQMFQQFELFFLDGDGGWQIGLVPRDPQLRAVLAQIRLLGSSDLERVEIVDHAGDTTVVAFRNRRLSGPELSEAERALYAF